MDKEIPHNALSMEQLVLSDKWARKYCSGVITDMFDKKTRIYIFQLVDTLDWYTVTLRDPMMVKPPAWYHSFCLCEVFFQFPFFFVATYAFWKGNRYVLN